MPTACQRQCLGCGTFAWTLYGDGGEPIADPGYCAACHVPRAEGRLKARLEHEASTLRKLDIIFGRWWAYYAPPRELIYTLYRERSGCPYCGEPLGPCDLTGAKPPFPSDGRAHLDHIEPLARGGEDAYRNVVFACDRCNLAKGNKTFASWLATLQPEASTRAREIYVARRGEVPEAFRPAPKEERLERALLSLRLSEEVLRTLYRQPVVNGPPGRK